MVELVECPRDAMQGIKNYIPADEKVRYLNSLLKVGFSVIDFGSFVSPKAIPQLADTAQVLSKLAVNESSTKLLAIIANPRGAEEASALPEITYLGYPFSLSETFQQRNTNRGIPEAFRDLQSIADICNKKNKKLVVYFSMGFGNPYGDKWSAELVEEWLIKLDTMGVQIISLADTVGNAKKEDIEKLFGYLIPKYPQITIGAHFHSAPEEQKIKLEAAYLNGCRRFDSAMLGYGGCPMAEDELVGNISTEYLLQFLKSKGEKINLNEGYFEEAQEVAQYIFSNYA